MIKLNLKPEENIVSQFAWFAPVGLGLIAWFVLRLAKPSAASSAA